MSDSAIWILYYYICKCSLVVFALIIIAKNMMGHEILTYHFVICSNPCVEGLKIRRCVSYMNDSV